MYTKRNFSIILMYFFTWRIILWSLFTGFLALGTYQYLGWKWVAIPWLPVSLIGTAVAFYVGFKNNQSYDRSWEARKIWGSIVNLSRAYISSSKSFINNEFSNSPVSDDEIAREIKTIAYRHIAWLYTLKHAMWQRTTWEHQHSASRRQRDYFRKKTSFGEYEDEIERYLSKEEKKWALDRKNPAIHLLDKQSQHLTELKKKGLLDEFRQIELQKYITELMSEQGKSERIKNTPLPRQFATASTIFIVLFTFLLPFGMLGEFENLGDGLIWLMVPFNLVVSWVFSLMEYMGDFSENPFEGLINDVPIHSIVRTIEIDVLEMIGEKDLPEKVHTFQNVLF